MDFRPYPLGMKQSHQHISVRVDTVGYLVCYEAD